MSQMLTFTTKGLQSLINVLKSEGVNEGYDKALSFTSPFDPRSDDAKTLTLVPFVEGIDPSLPLLQGYDEHIPAEMIIAPQAAAQQVLDDQRRWALRADSAALAKSAGQMAEAKDVENVNLEPTEFEKNLDKELDRLDAEFQRPNSESDDSDAGSI